MAENEQKIIAIKATSGATNGLAENQANSQNSSLNDKAKELPNNIEAEQYLLGALMNNNEYINRVGDFLQAENFYEPLHQKIYQTILSLSDKGIIANAVTLKNHFQGNEAIEFFGGVSYLLKLSGLGAGITNIRDYGLLIYNLHISRQLINIANETLEDSYNATGDETASKQIETPESKLFQLASEGFGDTGFSHAKNAISSAVKFADVASKGGFDGGVTTSFKSMDDLIGGFNKSDLIILAARPSMGKTALALNFALNVAGFLKQNFLKNIEQFRKNPSGITEPTQGAVGVISLEMSAEQLATRFLSIKTGINAFNIRRGHLKKSDNIENDEFNKLIKASQDLQNLPIFIDDTPALSISAVRTRARRLKRKHNLEFLIVDYLQLIHGTNKKSQESRVQEISEISMGLKAIAKELNIPVLALSQLSRKVEERTDKKPQLADLRESGSIEQDADIVMFIYREAYYEERKKPSEESSNEFNAWRDKMEKIDNISEIIVAKNRNGPIGSVNLYFDKNTTQFTDYAEEY